VQADAQRWFVDMVHRAAYLAVEDAPDTQTMMALLELDMELRTKQAEQVIAESLAEEARTLLTLREAADVWLKRFNELAEDAKRAQQEAA
jgi:hypothetical protein